MRPFERLDELIVFLLNVSGSVSLYWRKEKLTLVEDESGFHGDVSRCGAREMQKQWMAA